MYDTGIFHISFFRDVEDDGKCEFLFVWTQGAEEIAETFGQHRYGTVYQINGRCAFLGFLIDDTSFFYIMGHIGYMYAYFP